MASFPDDQILGRLDRNLYMTGDVVEVAETTASGAGILSMAMRGKSVTLRLRQTIPWLSQKRCGDAIVFEFHGDRLVVHLVELKSTITPDEWDKVRDQLHGAYHNALAMAGVLHATGIDELRVHVAYTVDRLSPRASAVASSFKSELGLPRKGDLTDWANRRMQIDDVTNVPINLILRGADGNAAVDVA